MLRCWLDERNQRPKFGEIVQLLDEMLANPGSDELRRPSRVREALPINPRAPTKVQLTSTKQFLARLALDHYKPQFEATGFGNLSKLFHLDTKDLATIIGVQSQLDQKRIVEELKRISDAVSCQNSYTLFGAKTLQQHHHHHQPNQSIFNIIRSNISANPNSDLLSFSAMPVNNHTAAPNNSNGFLV